MDNSGEVADKKSCYILSLWRYMLAMQGKYLYVLVTYWDLWQHRGGMFLFMNSYFQIDV